MKACSNGCAMTRGAELTLKLHARASKRRTAVRMSTSKAGRAHITLTDVFSGRALAAC
jgi:hypothetical protein